MDVRDMLCTMLEARGWKTCSAQDGNAGLAKLMKSRPDVVLCDIMMPELDGFAVHDAIRTNPQMSSLPFVFVSAIMDQRLSSRLSAAYCSFVRKPFTLAQIEDAIDKARQTE